MKYISTRGRAPSLDFEAILLAGLADDGGLYLPETYPQVSAGLRKDFTTMRYSEVAYHIIRPFIGGMLDDSRLIRLIDKAYSCFSDSAVAPLVPLSGRHYLLELFHGPSLAFKDIAMQLLAQLIGDSLSRRGVRATIIGATSGDTGAAAIEAFHALSGVDVFILYPHGRVSDVQRRQMTTVSASNVHAVAIEGTFDDCQNLVKRMFNDSVFRSDLSLTGVNSINWARIMAQIVYYFTASAAVSAPPVFSVPTGNFGDIFAGYVAFRMGLPLERLIIATNVNDILVRALSRGSYALHGVIATTSPSMDIQISSNFERQLFEVLDRDSDRVLELMSPLSNTGAFTIPAAGLSKLRAHFLAYRVDEAETARTISDVMQTHQILIDPHSAVGFAAARACEADTEHDISSSAPIVTLATAHPSKFPDAVRAACNATNTSLLRVSGDSQSSVAELPARLRRILSAPERLYCLPNDLSQVQDFIRAHAE